jgi:hypothetical protein
VAFVCLFCFVLFACLFCFVLFACLFCCLDSFKAAVSLSFIVAIKLAVSNMQMLRLKFLKIYKVLTVFISGKFFLEVKAACL